MELGSASHQSFFHIPPQKSLVCFLGPSTRGLHKSSRYHTYHNRMTRISDSLHMAGYTGSWPGRNRKSKRMCSFSVNSTFSLKDTWDHSPRGLPSLNFVTLPIYFYADPDSGWLILGRTLCIPLSSQEKLFLAWLLTYTDLCMERMVTYSIMRDTGI